MGARHHLSAAGHGSFNVSPSALLFSWEMLSQVLKKQNGDCEPGLFGLSVAVFPQF